MKSLSILVLLLFMLNSNVAFSKDGMARKITFKMACALPLDGYMKVYYPVEPLPEDDAPYDGAWNEIFLDTNNTSREHQAIIKSQLKFFAKPSETSRTLAKANMPTSANDFIIFLLANQENKRFKSIPVASKEIPFGSYCIFNFSQEKLYFQIDTKKKIVSPKQQAIIQPKSGIVQASIFRKDGDKMKIVRNTKWFIDSKFREFIFYYDKPIKWNHLIDNSVVSRRKTTSL